LNGFYTGLALILDPSGKALGISTSLLDKTPVKDFLLVGLFTFLIFGIFPLVAVIGLFRRKPEV